MKKIIFLLAMFFTISAYSQSVVIENTKIPKQAGNAGKYLKTNGSKLGWANVTAGFTGALTAGYIPYAVSSSSLSNSAIQTSTLQPFSLNNGQTSINYLDRLCVGYPQVSLGSWAGNVLCTPYGSTNALHVATYGFNRSLFRIGIDGSFELGEISSSVMFTSNGVSTFALGNGTHNAYFGVNTDNPQANFHTVGSAAFQNLPTVKPLLAYQLWDSLGYIKIVH